MAGAAILRRAAGAQIPTDPYFANVVALLHLDGANGSTVFADRKGHAFTGSGGAALSTAQQKFGPSSLLLNGTSQYIQSSTSVDWEMGAGDFTVECWIYPAAAIVARNEVISRWNLNGFGISVMDAGGLRAFAQGATAGLVIVGPGATTVTHAAWHHIAFVRDGTTLRLFLDGASQATATFNGTINAIAEPLRIGQDSAATAGRFFNGHIDEVRITKGIARYKANFTPPSAPFPDR